MKRQLTVAMGLMVLATPVMASKARLQALGEDSYGSAYINDNRNIWLNAAQINNHKDLVTYEFGGNVREDSAETARGEGGVYKSMGNLVYGLHFGGASNTGNGLRAAAGLVNASGTTADPILAGSANEENNIDVFVGGDAGIKWGANLGYAKTSQENDPASAESLRTRLGVIMGDTQVYANINLINNAKGSISANAALGGPFTGTSKFEGKLGYQVGAIHALDGNTFFADYRSFDMESTVATGGALTDGKEDLSSKQLEVGVGRVERLNDKSNLFVKASYFMRNLENDHGKTGKSFANFCGLNDAFCDKSKTNMIPVVVGLETEATSWLTLRGSISQAVWGTEKISGTESTIRNSTVVNAGATLKFGELSVDGVVGNTDGTVTGNDTSDGNGTLRTDNLMTRVAMTYRF